MHHEIVGPEQNIIRSTDAFGKSMSSQLRIPKDIALAQHLAQYSTRSMFEHDARIKCIDEIVEALGIEANEVPFHGRDEVNLTLMMIDDGRKDLAKILWTEPDKFKSENSDFVTLGLRRVDVILDHQQEWESGKATIKEWKDALEKVK